MEVELFSNALSEEDTVEVDADFDNLGDEGERCGICMDVVLDRGVLDCCQHWFCFACIDNWSTITNLCPLCQNEFQLITCVPVYDAIGGSKNDDESDSRDDGWSVEGKNNTLSFPSYYIDENAVTCLDGDACKIRNGSMTYEETLTLDTSIACDSCDIWYHAFCVGFDPEGTGVDSWLCPRCLVNEADQSLNLKEWHRSGKNDHQHCLVDTSTGKLSICVADSGETAVVVSRINGENVVDEPNVNRLSSRELTDNCKAEQSVLVLIVVHLN
ncbi:PHD and RING finger domain-containing protein 1 [Bienertia sinuspersici]